MRPSGHISIAEGVAASVLGLLWMLPLLFALWAALHPQGYATKFVMSAPLTLDNFVVAWSRAPFARYFLNTFILVTIIIVGQFVLCTLAAYAFARTRFRGDTWVFALILVQLMITPDVLMVENYKTVGLLGQLDSVVGIALPYMASAFGVFLLRQAFKQVPKELDEAAQVEGASSLYILWKVYVPSARAVYLAYGLVSVSFHWNNFLWPLVVTNSVETRPLTVGLSLFAATETGVDWAIISAATVISVAPLVVAFLLFQRQFVQSFIRAGIK